MGSQTYHVEKPAVCSSLKLSNVDLAQHSDGWPLGNTKSCKLCDRPRNPVMDTMSAVILTKDRDTWWYFLTDLELGE